MAMTPKEKDSISTEFVNVRSEIKSLSDKLDTISSKLDQVMKFIKNEQEVYKEAFRQLHTNISTLSDKIDKGS